MIHMFAIHYCGHSAEEVWVLSLLSLAEPDEDLYTIVVLATVLFLLHCPLMTCSCCSCRRKTSPAEPSPSE